jgi:hypothetical protein
MYLASTAVGTATTWHSEKGLGNQSVSLKGFVVKSKAEIAAATVFPSNADISVEMHVELEHPQTGLCVGFDLIGRDGETILRSYNTDVAPEEQTLLHAGTNLLCCLIPRGLLNAGAYQIAPRISIHNQEWISNGEPLVGFSVILNHGESPFWNSLDEQSRPGRIAPIFRWINFNKNDRLNVF